jgi:hypothetical protein
MASLQLLFAVLNWKFFKGRLKGYRVKRVHLPGGMMGRCDSETRTIKIQRGLRGEDLRRILLHEMCHHTAGTARHGKLFEKELRRLGKLGEAWVEEEIRQCREVQPFRAMVEELAENIAMELGPEHVSWRGVKRCIAHQCGLTSPELGRGAPWLRKFWEREQKSLSRRGYAK